MMDWTDRHCRAFHRVLTRHAVLYTEMVTADAVRFGKRAQLLDFSDLEHPIAVQLGGSDPVALAEAARICSDWGYDEINLNVGCPSDRVQAGRFGACLMREPALVADCLSAMRAVVDLPVTVKHRIGVDDQVPEDTLFGFVETLHAAGTTVFIVHARKAILAGLSPKDNRTVPPLDYDLVHRLKRAFPAAEIIINGGFETVDACVGQLAHLDGVMVGRAAYHTPAMLGAVDRMVYGDGADVAPFDAVAAHRPYIAAQLAEGVPLHTLLKPMLGLFAGMPGGRLWRQVISVEGVKRGAGIVVLDQALEAVRSRVQA
jgi:tRNA-dihydrouridine synthase A